MELPIQIEKENGIPLYVQLEEQIRWLVHEGFVGPGDLLPTVRELSVQMEINSNTVARVYRDLKRDGLLELKRGVGTFVSDKAKVQPLGHVARRKLERQVDALVASAKELSVKPGELYQLIQTRW